MTTYAHPHTNNSDVHVINANGWLTCCRCTIRNHTDYRVREHIQMIDHLALHSIAGHHVPDNTTAHLIADMLDQQERGPL
ncbi:hypothetical protein BJF84_13405 [Rhodococcus sp. CUA-806]|jgi:hypothetical protein|nr:hypothetical protein BJF84_13405 [Rhodococcus sp. CUA-806]